jgi:2-polyprenyl-3-methyl-5-hydroxy-6-metoxy-1,4-benzoquinol methylase
MNQTQFHSENVTSSEQSTFEKVKRLVDFQSGEKLTILDVGCGVGSLDSELASMGHNVTGLDVSNLTQEPQTWKYIQTDINNAWPIDPGSQDVVICTDVPEHLYDPTHILKEAQRVLKPNGKLIFGVPNHFDLRQRLRILFGKGIVHWDTVQYSKSAWDYSHIRFFTHNEVVEKFSQLGWHIDAAQFNFMGAGIVPSRLLPGFIKILLLKLWPGLFSGKFIYSLSRVRTSQSTRFIYIPSTPTGL